MTAQPAFNALTPRECESILRRNHVGRLAFRNGAEIDIQPLSYVANGQWLFMRSAYGAKMEAIAHSPYVALEVDEIDGPFDWRSVVAHGTIYALSAEGGPVDRREFQRAVKALRRVMPSTLTLQDPVPQRETVYGLHIQRLEGRMAESNPKTCGAYRMHLLFKAPPKRRVAPNAF